MYTTKHTPGAYLIIGPDGATVERVTYDRDAGFEAKREAYQFALERVAALTARAAAALVANANALVAYEVSSARGYEPDAEELAEAAAWMDGALDAVAYTLPAAELVEAALGELLRTAIDAGDAVNARALGRAVAMVDAGLYARVTALADGSLIVPSQRTGEPGYVVGDAGCSCHAGRWGKPCAHSALVEGIVLARDVRAAELDDEATYRFDTRITRRALVA